MARLWPSIKKRSQSDTIDLSANEMVIASGVIANGTIETDRDIFIDGNYRGDIKTLGYIKLGTNCSVEGKLSSRAIRLQGHVKGELMADTEIVIDGGSELDGSAEANSIEINKDAAVNAKIITRADKT